MHPYFGVRHERWPWAMTALALLADSPWRLPAVKGTRSPKMGSLLTSPPLELLEAGELRHSRLPAVAARWRDQ